MAGGDVPEDFAVKSYRYLRLAIVVVVTSLLVSLLLEASNVPCWQGSISAYYYTPVRAIFVTALVVIGVNFIVIKGRTTLEDVLLNLAGVLAPIVALVPTSPSSPTCSSVNVSIDPVEPFIHNNVLSFAIGGAVAIAIAIAVASLKGRDGNSGFTRGAIAGLLFGVALLGAGVGWYYIDRSTFLERAHGFAAVAMFVALGVVILVNALRVTVATRYRYAYAALVAAMVVSALGVVAGGILHETWRHEVLWLEFLELSIVAVYWVIQTVEHWHGVLVASAPAGGRDTTLDPSSSPAGGPAGRC